jgi:hypothetical protein
MKEIEALRKMTLHGATTEQISSWTANLSFLLSQSNARNLRAELWSAISVSRVRIPNLGSKFE